MNTTLDTDAVGAPCILYPQPPGASLVRLAGASVSVSSHKLFVQGSHPVVLLATHYRITLTERARRRPCTSRTERAFAADASSAPRAGSPGC